MNVTASAAVSSDGYMDDSTPARLVLSNEEDWKEVHRLRARSDAILVGAETVRRDNPALVIRDAGLRRQRVERGMKADIAKVVVTGSGRLDPSLRFFTEAKGAQKIVIAGSGSDKESLRRLSAVAEIIFLPVITASGIIGVLSDYGIRSLLVEGGAQTMKMFMDENAIDLLRLAVSPVTVGDPFAPRFPYFGKLPFENSCPVKRLSKIEEMKVFEYGLHSSSGLLDDKDCRKLLHAIELSGKSIPCSTCYRVGCVAVTSDGKEYEGYTHETGPHNHAEEEAVKKALCDGADLQGATVYTSMEPCSARSSKPESCSELLIRHGVGRVVYAYAEPDCFVRCEGSRMLQEAGVEVVEAAEYSAHVREINSHVIHD